MQRGQSQENPQRFQRLPPGLREKNELRRRIYDSGISHFPMPSVKRPIEENADMQPFSAKMNAQKVQNLSPVKKRYRELTTGIVKNMNDLYGQDNSGVQDHNASLDQSFLSQGMAPDLNHSAFLPNPFLGPSAVGSIPSIANMKQQRMMTAKGYSQTANSMTGVQTMSRLQPFSSMGGNKKKVVPYGSNVMKKQSRGKPREVPPLDPGVKDRLNQSLNQQMMDNSLVGGPPALVHVGFEGGASISQKNLEQARSRFLLDKLTGKLPQELRGGLASTLPPLMEMEESPSQDDLKKSRLSQGVVTPKSSTRKGVTVIEADDGETVATLNKPVGEDGQKTLETRKWNDLDKYIELLLDSKSDDEIVFVYVNPNENGDPYDLKVCGYHERKVQKYYTLSGKGLTVYENDNPVEFISLGQWLIERDSYNHIKELPFFKKFKRWKFMRMWKKTIKQQNRMKAATKLKEKLFYLHPIFRTHLMMHRAYSMEMEKLRFVDVSSNLETQNIADFGGIQQKKRKEVMERIQDLSEKCRDNIKEGITKVLSELRERITSEIAMDEERKKNNPIQSSTSLTLKQKTSKSVFEDLGFPEGMSYGHRASLREECSRFLRFAYLIDFLSLEALSNVYIGSVKDLIWRLKGLDELCDIKGVMEMDIDEANKQPTAPARGQDPLFYIKIDLNDRREIPEDAIEDEQCEEFKEPPHGTSTVKDFNLHVHLELEEEEVEEAEGEGDESSEQDKGSEMSDQREEEVIKYTKRAKTIQNYWLQLNPAKEKFLNLITTCFSDGLECIQVFERWSKHTDMQAYSNALEDWDDRVGDNWDPPESNYLNPKTWINEHPIFSSQTVQVKELLSSSYDKAQIFLTRFQPILEMYWSNKSIDLSILVHERLKNPTDSLIHTIDLFGYQEEEFAAKIPLQTSLGLLQLDSKKCRDTLIPYPKKCIAELEEIIPNVISDKVDVAKKWLSDCTRKLNKNVSTVEDFVEQNNNLTYTVEHFQKVKDNVHLYGQYLDIMTDKHLKTRKEDKDSINQVNTIISGLNQIIQDVEAKQDSSLEKFKKALEDLIPELNNEIDTLHGESIDEMFLSGDTKMIDALRKLDTIEDRFKELDSRSLKYQSWQEVLQTQQSQFGNLGQLREDFKIRADMWRSLKSWEEKTENWIGMKFDKIDAQGIQDEADKYEKISRRVEKTLEENPIGHKLKELVETFKGTMPVVKALRCEDLQEHHWNEIKTLLNSDFDIYEENFTLNSLIEMNAVQFQEEIEGIATQASQEASLRRALQALEDQWRKIDFITKPYKDKDAFVLDEIEDIYTNLDDSLAAINTILGSRFVKPLRSEAEIWKKNLFTLNQIVEEWVICQKQWIYLENIFTAPDIKRQLSTESAKFETVDKFFKTLMNKTAKAANAIRIVKTNHNLHEQLRQNNQVLEEIQKKLDQYLEKKRSEFPRFYFLSNDELLGILANSNNLDVVQQNLRTCFDNIVKLEILEGQDIVAMISGEGEKVMFSKITKVRGQVEQWLLQVQGSMRETLQKLMKQGYQDYTAPGSERKEWVMTHFGQIVATVAQIMWCQTTEVFIQEMAGNSDALQDWFEGNVQQLSQLTELVRGNLTNIQRKIIVALVTTDVHARDIVEILGKEQVSNLNEFIWVQQLRYYWDEEVDDCRIKQVNAKMKYGYEYMGATSRLVITPLTDKCWMTITGALHIKLGAAPAGPAGTGKTESTKDLAKAVGIQCIVFNCSDQVDYKMMGRLFSGLAQQGAWTCLDEFNRIDIEVLSVIAQQLLTIRVALLGEVEHFKFEGLEIPLQPTIGVFITMNPGYAGRTELPDNLKVLFRPVSMMIPDYGLIAEIMLFAEGFDNAKVLSKKMVKLYKLSSEQLSQQDHYDFGMRAVKSVLVMAGALKRQEKDMDEDGVLIRAMRDSNIPKFLNDDLPLFQAIVQDLFPSAKIKEADYGELQTEIEKSIITLGFQKIPAFITKVIQLFDTFNVRFGVMIVGPTGAGKTKCYEVLQHAMTQLRVTMKSENQNFQSVKKNILNPKSISMGELYGEVNPISQDWTDGLASKIMRAAALEEEEEKTWVVFDGPVDALWIENMNTVLDDNMTLCLANGQRIKLRLQMRMLFEVQDLAVASPATVSRCGMVYMTPEAIGWKPYVLSWIPRFFHDDTILNDNLRAHLKDTFEHTIDLGIKKIRNNFVEKIPTVDIQLVVSTCNFLEVLIDPKYGFKGKNDDEKKKILDSFFVFAYTWGMGAALDELDKERFDDAVKDAFKSVQIPNSMTVFDYFFDAKKDQQFKPWSSKVPNFVYDKEVQYFELMVPTIDTYRYSYMLSLLLEKEKGSFFTGVTGVGKSCIIQNMLNQLVEKDLITININFSAQTSSHRTQQTIEGKLEKKKRTLFGALPGKKIAIFVDDINMPMVEEYGAQPPIELLRLFTDKKGFYDREELIWKDVEDTTLVCAAAPPGGGRSPTTPRFTRHFNLFCLPEGSKGTLGKIFGSILRGFLKIGFQESVQQSAEPMIDSTIEIYQQISESLRPTPARFHYLFNLRDISKVFQGILMVKPISCQEPEVACRLWVNEMCRVFYDRLINDEDRLWFTEKVCEMVNVQFRVKTEHDDLFKNNKTMWSEILKLDATVRLYEEIQDKDKLKKTLENILEDYNITNTNKMNLVFFDDCIDHMLRVARVLRQPRGNSMLIGVGGSGKQSVSRLSASMLEIKYRQVEITKNFGPDQFKEFLKEMMFQCGIDGDQVSFVMTDNQIIDEGFLEDINNILNTGEVPNLMEAEDKDHIINEVRPILVSMKKVDTIDNINNFFVQRVRDNLHIVLCMSPVGDSLRVRCRQFPSLVNCCTLDWFTRWPEDALYYVSQAFLADLQLPNEEVREQLALMCMVIHTSVENMAEKFYERLRRRVYTTPKSYLDLINLYLGKLDEKRNEYNLNKNRLAIGLKKLNDTNENIAVLRVTLKDLQPKLMTKNEELKVALEIVNKDKKVADEKDKVVSAEAEIVNQQAADAKIIVDDVQQELDKARPELEAASAAVAKLDKKSITEIRSFPSPPDAVVMVMEAVMILLNEKLDWKNIKAVMGGATFLDGLKNYDVKNASDSMFNKIRKNYISKKAFMPEEIGKKSMAAQSMCIWVRALNTYSFVLKKVAPKQEKYEEVKGVLDAAMSKLAVKEKELKEVKDKVAKLEADCKMMQDEKDSLEAEMDKCSKRMGRAEKLVVLLADEGVRWKETVESMEIEIERLIGNVFLSAACISYYGGFTGQYRQELVEGWVKDCIAKNIPTSENFDLVKIMGDPVQIRNWNIATLPSDQVSTQNGILATVGERWPLMIDPQQQANKWIKNLEKQNDIIILKFSTNNFLRTLGSSITIGKPVLVEDISEFLDPGIDPVLGKQVFKSDSGIKQIRLGDGNLDYDENFKFYMTTKMPNPHYLPEVCIKVTLINFTVTFKGLEDQMLGDVVIQEKPEVEKKRDEIIVSMANDQKTLKQIETTILSLLSESTEEEILDEDKLINILEDSKKTSAEINERLKLALVVEEEITQTRDQYRDVAIRGSIIYFVIADLAGIDPMYQYSLAYVKRLFNNAIEQSEKFDDLEKRLEILIENITRMLYTNVSRGLFEAHKIIFSFMSIGGINRNSGKVRDDVWNVLLRGPNIIPKDADKQLKNPDIKEKIILEKSWYFVYFLDQVLKEVFGGLMVDVRANWEKWQEWIKAEDPHLTDLPGEWEEKLTRFQKMIILKVFRPEKLMFAFIDYVKVEMGQFYIEPPPATMEVIYPGTDVKTPMIYVLSQGADPTSLLYKFAGEMNAMERLFVISLGQGQGPRAEELIHRAKKNGEWVMLQNCHLAKSWMPKLEVIVQNFADEEHSINPDFRLFLTSMPATYFPVSTLQNGVKLTTEPPRGIRANLKRSYNELTEEQFNACKKEKTYKKLCFGLCFFHSVIQERRKFGPLGWNIRYEFNDSDLETSLVMLRMFLDEQDEIPWDALTFVTGHINYGGRVTDDWDRICLLSILKKYYTEEILTDGYKFSDSGLYYAPTNGELTSYREYIDKMPMTEGPEVFGMHKNANITYQTQQSNVIIETILSIQPRVAVVAGGKSPDEIVTDLALKYLEEIPKQLSRQMAKKDTWKTNKQGLLPSLTTVLLQEMQRFSKLIQVIKASLIDIEKAIKGIIVMDQELDTMYVCFQNNKVPPNWEKVAYPSLKPLSSWYLDLAERVNTMEYWLVNGQPSSFWISGFFFPQGFMTGVLQNHARKEKIPIDQLNYTFKIMEEEEPDEIDEAPEDGVYVYGLFMDGARWDRETQTITDQFDSEMYSKMPLIWFKPAVNPKSDPEDYICPIYKTSVRAGVLSTTGQSTNFIVGVDLPTKESPAYWTLKGAALNCMLND